MRGTCEGKLPENESTSDAFACGACVRACLRACVRACVRVRVRACVRAGVIPRMTVNNNNY